MTRTCDIIHQTSGRTLVAGARWCDSFAAKFRGFMLQPTLDEAEGLVLVEKRDNRVNTAIHMLFVRIDLGVNWVNEAGRVVDQVVARPWRLSYAPQAPARYVIECHPHRLADVAIGDQIRFDLGAEVGR